MIKENKSIIINKKNINISCPNETNKTIGHPKIFLNSPNLTCKYCNTTYIIK
ncbi:MAG TPA: hypothetical protein V8P47_01780 [Candidatus Azosocius sp. HAIN]